MVIRVKRVQDEAYFKILAVSAVELSSKTPTGGLLTVP